MGSNMQRPNWWSSEIELAFEKFHDENPHIYEDLVNRTRMLKRMGRRRVGMKMLFEVLRWQHLVRTAADDFKLNNDYTSRYARLIMEQEPDLEGMFETRGLKS